jgi:hypothetical protein
MIITAVITGVRFHVSSDAAQLYNPACDEKKGERIGKERKKKEWETIPASSSRI